MVYAPLIGMYLAYIHGLSCSKSHKPFLNPTCNFSLIWLHGKTLWLVGAHILCTIALVLPKIWCTIRTATKWTWGSHMDNGKGLWSTPTTSTYMSTLYRLLFNMFFVRIVIHNKHIMCMCILYSLKDNLHIFEPIRSLFHYVILICGSLALLVWECKWQILVGWPNRWHNTPALSMK